MRVQLLPSAFGGRPLQFAMSYLINDVVAVDAGSLGLQSSLDLQQRVQHVFLTHSHQDHIASLPLWLDNVYQPTSEAPALYANEATWATLRSDVLNDRVWPDLERVSSTEFPFYCAHELRTEQSVRVAGLEVTPVLLDHVVPAMGYLIDDGRCAVVFVSDTGPTERIWQLAAANPRLKAVFIEASFPNRLLWLAEKTMHLTPRLAFEELKKLGRTVPTWFIHLKPHFHEEIAAEILQAAPPAAHIVEAGREIVIDA